MEVADFLNLDAEQIDVEKEEITSVLKRIGLTDYESRAYLGLVMRSQGTAEDVADVAGIPRTSAYKVLDSLKKREMVSVSGGRPAVFLPSPPKEVRDNLLADVDRAFQRMERLQGVLSERGVPQLVYTIVGRDRILAKVGELFDYAQDTLLISSPVLRDIMADHAGRISNALKRGVRVKVIAEPSTRVPEGVEVVRKPDLLATDVIVDSKQALIASPDLSICGYTDNPFLSSHFEYFLSI
ncbi:MAG: TrmB family transcriptional regulator [Euryarchaeota archaeon]|nr:TrmB family transcriptional regulator [Euryarchaeota archaeon]